MTEASCRRVAFIFPGQGVQFVGMGKELAASFASARMLFEELDETLSEKLTRTIFEGADADLRRTENAQPALMSVSLAVVRVLEQDFGLDLCALGSCAAGHSLGEYSALTAARALSFADSVRLLRLRGASMQGAVPEGEGAMVALLGLDIGQASEVAARAQQETGAICTAANDNSPGQVVVSGSVSAIERVQILAKEWGARRVIRLEVSAPFHCPLMAPAQPPMAEALVRTNISSPMIPVYANVTAAPEQDPETWRSLLVRQICASVRWRESLLAMGQEGGGGADFVELGAGRALCGMVKRTLDGASCLSCLAPRELEQLAQKLTS